MAGQLWIGTSGWVYPHWRGVFYPDDLPQGRWFAHYARHFATVEVNNTFYRLPGEAAFVRWREQAPPGFRYALKANRFLTHIKRLNDCAEPLERFLSRARLLGDRLGPLLYQLPPHWHCRPERLAAFLPLLPGDLTHVLEFRDESWLVEPVFDLLAQHGVGLCLASMPGLPCPLRATSPVVYMRMHGWQYLYGDKYPLDELRRWAERLAAFQAEGRDVYVYFNNDAFGYAVENALELKAITQTSQNSTG